MSEDKFKNNEKILKEAVKNKNIGSLYLFYGTEEYLKRNYTNYIEEIILAYEFKLMNKVVLEGKITPSAIIGNCETPPVFSDRKLVVVKNSGLFKGKRKDGVEVKQAKQDDEFTQFLKNIPMYACLIFVEAEIDKRIKYVNLIDKHGLVVEFDYRKPEEMANWILKMVKTRKHEMDLKTAAQLAEYCEPGMDDVFNEIEKLCLYAGDRPLITVADIRKVCFRSVKSRVFDLTDAIGTRNCAKALSLLNDLAAIKEPMPKVMYMIMKQFRQLMQIKLMKREGANKAEITARLKLHPFFSGKIIQQSDRFSMEKLEKAVSTGLALDLAIKTGKIEDRTAVELMIISTSD